MASKSRFPDIIACHVEMFSENMQVFVYKNNTIQNVTVPGEDLVNVLVKLCHDQNIFDLHLSGDSAFLEGFIHSIKETEMLQYGVKDQIKIKIV